MALHPELPASPYAILDPEQRWFPAAEELRSSAYEKLLPPLVARVREEVGAWRESGYAGSSATSKALLHWWFDTEHLIEQANGADTTFRYYFAQREAVEIVLWLHDVKRARQVRSDAILVAGRDQAEPVRRRLAALRAQAGDRRWQDQGVVSADCLVLFPQDLRAGLVTGTQYSVDRTEHHCA